MRKMISFCLATVLFLFMLPGGGVRAGGLNIKRIWALPAFGLAVLAGVGAGYFRKEALSLHDEAEGIYREYLAIPQGQPNEVFELKYEAYQEKLAEAEGRRTYYLVCMGGGVLALAFGVYILVQGPSSSKSVSFGYNMDIPRRSNDLYMRVRF